MAMDPRQNVRPGDKLRIAAEQVNFLNGLMRQDTGFKSGSLDGYEPGKNIILARNSTGADLPRWGVMLISGIEIDPATDDTRRRSFEEMPCITGAKPNATTGGKFVIAVEPIKDGKIGRVCAAGIVQAKVSFSSASHTRAKPKDDTVGHLESAADGPAEILWSGGTGSEQWALIRFGGGGGQLRVGKYTGSSAWALGDCATVTLWKRTEEYCSPTAIDPPETVENVVNLSYDVPADSWVVIGQLSDEKWYLLESGKEGYCRQTIGGEDITKWPGWNATKVQLLGHDASGCLKWFDVADECEPSTSGQGGGAT